MRFEIVAAYVMGLLLPVLETCRRGFGHWSVSTMTMLEDYAGGGLLLFAAVLSTRGRKTAPLWMVVAWTAISAMLATSFFYHLEETLRGGWSGPRTSLVLAVKSVLLGTSVVALAISMDRCRRLLAE